MSEDSQERTHIAPEAAAEVRAHAEACYPEECCGLIFDSGPRRCRNVQGELHADDPEAFPRTARRAFRLADADQLALARSFDGPTPARVLYHSHIDADAYLSAVDVAGATIAGQPLYPELLHLVVSVRDGVAGELALFELTTDGATEIWRQSGTARD
jgi:proteasome lid subunit RPN8/RPN11